MPLYMDIHSVPGVKALDVAEAHRKDLLLQEEHQCKCMTYWIDEGRETIFCLIEAPDKDLVAELHAKSHGLIPTKIIEVKSTLVEAFLGRIYDPVDAETSDDGLKIFEDPSFRIILVTKTSDPVLLWHKLGREKANELLGRQNGLVREKLIQFQGREVEHKGEGFIASFTSATKAVSCALAIQKEILPTDIGATGLRIGINAGEPVSKADKLFGDTIQLADFLCSISSDCRIAIAASVKSLLLKDLSDTRRNDISSLAPQDEHVLQLLFIQLETNWQNPEFNVEMYCKAMAMSNSQLYRKTVELCGLSPNSFLMNFKLDKAKDLLKQRRLSISQITFDAGFASPSYFTKCFKKKYGLLPMAYLDLLH